MSDTGPPDGLTRRALLRRSTAAAGVATLGTAAFSGRALASVCPKSPGYWANHDWCDVDVDPDRPSLGSVAQSIGLCCGDENDEEDCDDEYELADTGVSKGMEGWQDFLTGPTKGDKGRILGRALLATTLNFQVRPSDDPDCVDKELDLTDYGIDDDEINTVRDVKQEAETWLNNSNFDDEQRDWVVNGTDGEPLKDVLDDFNNNNLGLECDCDGSNESGGNGNGNGNDNGNGNGNGNGNDNGNGNGNGKNN